MNAHILPPLLLIADAEPYVCRVFEAKLIKDNLFRVICASAAADAFQAALLQPFDLILWDLRLRDSERLLPALRALSPQAALLLMTTDDLPRLSAEIARLDVTGVLTKPFGLDTLIENIRAALSAAPSFASNAAMDLGRVGQQLAIYSPEGLCVTRVLESGSDTFAVVGAPRVETPLDFAPGRRVQVQVQGDDALYRFHTTLLRAVATPISGWELRMPQTIHRLQRRKNARIPLRLRISLADASLIPAESAVHAASEWNTGYTENIGMGGCSAICESDFPAGTLVSLELHCGNELCLEGQGLILRSHRLSAQESGESPAGPRYRFALQFIAFSRTRKRQLQQLLAAKSAK